MSFMSGTSRDERFPGRRKRILKKLGDLWDQYPDLRFNQLVLNIAGHHQDHFGLEDDKFEELLDAYIESSWRKADPYTDPEWLIWVKGISRAIRRLVRR